MKLTTDRHLVLQLRNNRIIPPLPPCTLIAYQGTALPVRLARRTDVTFVVVMRRIFFWDVTPFRLVDRWHRFEGTCCLCIQGKREEIWRWKPRYLGNIGISLHDDAASHPTRQYFCFNERAVKNFLSKWASEYVHKRRTINLFLNPISYCCWGCGVIVTLAQGLVIPADDFMFSLCLQGNDTTDTMTSFVFLVLAIHQPEEVSFVWCSGVPRNFFRGGVQQIQLRTERTGIWGW